MANNKSAKKRTVQNEARRKHNMSLRSAYRTSIKKVEALISANQPEAAAQELKTTTQTLDKVASKKIIHKNKAARYKSNLNQKIKSLTKSTN